MLRKLTGYFCVVTAAVLLVLAALTLFAMLRALTVATTLAAVESAFGSFVLCILLLVGARKLKDVGVARLKQA